MHDKNKNRKVNFMLLVALALATAAGVVALPALANGRGGRHAWMEARMQAHLEEALAKAKATPQQAAAVLKERDALKQQMMAGRKDHHAQMEVAVALFVADNLDARAIAAQRNKALDQKQKMVQAVGATLQRVHGLFNADQRKAIVAYVKAELPSQEKGGWRGRMMRHKVDSKVDEALTKLQANPSQRKQILAVKESLVQTFEAQHAAHRAELEQVLALFVADRLDPAQVAAIEQQHDARARDHADVMLRAATQVHDALTPAQRKLLVGLIKEHRHGGHD